MSFMQKIARYDDPTSIGSKFRAKRAQRIEAMIKASYNATGGCRILDMGGELSYWNLFKLDFLKACNVSITIANREFRRIGEGDVADIFTLEEVDCCELAYSDNSFDLAHSNSVIEHVGTYSAMEAFARETMRVAPQFYVQTPNYWFPIEPHFGTVGFHWLPEGTKIKLLQKRGFGQFPRAPDLTTAVGFARDSRLLTHQQITSLFPNAEIVSEKVLGLTKSHMAIRTMSP